MAEPSNTLHDKLNAETARIRWPELEPHYARGAVIVVDGSLDLVQVAQCVARDDKQQVAAWLESGAVCCAEPHHAEDWRTRDVLLWAVVTAPWVQGACPSNRDATAAVCFRSEFPILLVTEQPLCSSNDRKFGLEIPIASKRADYSDRLLVQEEGR